MIKAVLFDMDGTLLPMNQENFVKAYFSALSKKLAPHGYEPESVVDSIWKGSYAMVKNDGTRTNEEVFWAFFAQNFGDKVYEDKPIFDSFYENEFDEVKRVCGFNEKVKSTIKALKERGYKLVLASNPIFPAVAQKRRLSWTGADADDFDYITSYENSSFCKPNKNYYYEIAEKIGCATEECLMVGNDVGEDMIAKETGMKVFLITDCLINRNEKDISEYPSGNFEDLTAFINNLE